MACGKKAQMVLITILSLTMLTGCSNEQPQDADSFAIWSETRYSAEHVPLETYRGIYGAAIQKDTIYLTTYLSPIAGVTSLCTLDASNGELTQLTGYDEYILPPLTAKQEAGIESIARYSYDIIKIASTGDHLWLMADCQRDGTYDYDYAESSLLLLQAAPSDGAIKKEIVLSDTEYDGARISLCCDEQGNVYASLGTKIFVYDADGNILGQIATESGSLFTLPDGRCGFLSDTLEGAQWRLRVIDVGALSFQDEFLINSVEQDALSKNSIKVFDGTKKYDFLYASDLSLYGYHFGKNGQAGASEHILTWTDCDVDGTGVEAVRETEDGFLCLASSEAFGSEIVRLRPRGPSEQEPVTITLACQTLPYEVSQSVLRFNRQSPNVRVQIRDYGAISAKNGLAAGLDRFTTDLISGNISDIFYTGNLDEQMLIDRGMLEDLWPWIDADKDLGGREALVQPLFDAMSQNGKLYAVTNSFQIHTAIGYPDMVGNHEGWSVDELLKAYQSKPDCRSILPLYEVNRDTELERVIAMCAESFIDRQNWTADFDSPEFVKLLDYLTYIPESFMEEESCANWLLDREQLMQPVNIFQISRASTLFYGRLQVKPTEGTIVGYPGVAGNGGAFRVKNCMAMWSGSSHKKEAWMFLRSLLSPENQRSFFASIPSNRAACDTVIRHLSEAGIGRSPSRGIMEHIDWTQEDTDRFWSYVEGVTVVERTEENLAAIIRDEAARYFAGDQTAEAAASAIQSRVNLYLGERKK